MRLSSPNLVALFLSPTLIVATLFGSATYHGDSIGAHYVLLGLLAFSVNFPGTARFTDRPQVVFRDVVLNWAALAALILLFGYGTGYLRYYPVEVLATWFVATPLALLLAHEIARQTIPRILSREGNRSTAIIAGMTETGVRLAQKFRDNPYLGTELVGFFDDRSLARLPKGEANRVLGSLRELGDRVKRDRIDVIYVTLPMATQPRILAILDDLRDTTASIYFAPDIFLTEIIQGRMDEIEGIPMVAVCESPFTGINGIIKRASDLAIASLIVLLASPIMLAIALGVKLSSPGPILFKQRRYGADGKQIMVYKYRTMTVCEDGEKNYVQVTRNDSRVTRFGAFLRATSLDELPQFINVIQGTMSIVGPRPHAIAVNEQYRKLIRGYMVRHKVKPGITGWAQVNGFRGGDDLASMKSRIDYDLEYLRKWSIGLDLWIILRTAAIVFADRNAY